MLSWEQARARVVEIAGARMRRPRRERVPLGRALGRILAEPVVADRDLPPFPRAIRDGFALRAADAVAVPAEFDVVGEIKAGSSLDKTIGPGQAAEIMTGAPVPGGADSVVMIEHTRRLSELRMALDRPAKPGQHIVAQGSEARAGQTVLHPGRRIGFAEMAFLAEVGCARAPVFRQPRVAVLATGDEIVPLDRQPGPFQIRDSNSSSLFAQVTLAGGRAVPLGHAPDRFVELGDRLRKGLEADILVVSGGVSKGKYDLVKGVLGELGAEFYFETVAIRPGRPAVFAWCAGRPVFCLPGNPVSTMVTFELLVIPALDLLSGAGPRPLPLVTARLAQPLDEKEGLTHFLPARVEWKEPGPEARPVAWRGSGDLAGLAQSNGFIVVPADRPRWQAGETIGVVLRRELL
ncbi:MAG TPA: gephyrin-like molybdotransferase Glp [Patescibacteria group bacterium]|nr:gephyrin-like molybdotransferase Glp [Patescibacteria group bacterium]